MSKNSSFKNFNLLSIPAFCFIFSVCSMELEFTDIDSKNTNKNFLHFFCSKLAGLNPGTQISTKDIIRAYNKQEIDLFYRNIQFIPSEISLLHELQILSISNNLLTSIPKEIGALINLHTLNLSNNRISFLPKEIGYLKNLVKLDLYENQLTSIPKGIKFLKNLKMLSLPKNRLTSLPKEIGFLKELQVLTLYDNQLIDVPTEIESLQKLMELYLNNNPDLGEKWTRTFSGIDLDIFHQYCKEKKITIKKYMMLITPYNDDQSLLFYVPKDVVNVIFRILWEIQKNS